ncbi:MAG: peptidoglycan bridge formation glycyltransferase FemA/FemB family protein [Thermoproteota archaeon]
MRRKSKLVLEEYTSDFQEKWDKFVWNSRNGTLFHTQKFLGYHPENRFEDESLILHRKGDLFSVFPAASTAKNGIKTLYSHPGSSYGGFVITNYAGINHVFNILEELTKYCKQKGFNKVILKITPWIFNNYPSDEIPFALWHKDAIIEKKELECVIPLTFELDEYNLPKVLKNSCRRAILKSDRKGISVKQSDKFRRYWTILKEDLRGRHGATPTHSLQEIKKLKTLFPDRIRLFASFLEDELIAGVVVFVCNSKVIQAFYIAQDYEYQKYRPTNAVINEVMKWGKNQGYDYLTLGISTERGGEEINWGLFRFKESFGARGVLRTVYSLKV